MLTEEVESKPKKTAKKVAKKTAKKPTKQKTATGASRITKTLAPEEYFWVVNGDGLESLEALAVALEQMTEEQFAYHTRRDGNDFARWIGGVFMDEVLARKIVKQKTREKTAQVLRTYLAK